MISLKSSMKAILKTDETFQKFIGVEMYMCGDFRLGIIYHSIYRTIDLRI